MYRVATDSGLVGYGVTRGPVPPRSAVEPVIGRDPFDFVGSNLNHGLAAALYDLMGKRLEVPAYKLMGKKRRDAVSLAAWTRPCSPTELADEVRHAAAGGYTILKMHTSPLWDVMEHTACAEAAAPPTPACRAPWPRCCRSCGNSRTTRWSGSSRTRWRAGTSTAGATCGSAPASI